MAAHHLRFKIGIDDIVHDPLIEVLVKGSQTQQYQQKKSGKKQDLEPEIGVLEGTEHGLLLFATMVMVRG
jgi:hypothetical protein